MKTKTYYIVAEVLNIDPETLKPETNILTNLSADSLDVADIAMRLEEEFQISFNDDEYSKMTTIGDIEEIISKKIAAET